MHVEALSAFVLIVIHSTVFNADPISFRQNVTVEASFNSDGTFKRFEIEFIVRNVHKMIHN